MVLDFAEDGFSPTKKRPAAYWDADNDGRAEKCRWFTPGQALLAIDRDGDGRITDNAELFGSITLDAFAALRQMDAEGDGLITPADKISYPRLRVWFDDNADGQSAPEELKTLKEAGVVVLNLNPGKPRGKTDATRIGFFERHTKKRIVWQPLAAVNLFCDDGDTRPLSAEPPSPAAIATLPDLPAAGELPSLHDAMARDYAGSRSLYTQVRMLSATPLEALFAPERPLDAWVDEILFRWAGASESDRDRAGPQIDGRRLVFLAKVTGRKDYLQLKNPGFWDIYTTELAYRKYQAILVPQLALQTPAAELFAGHRKMFNKGTGTLNGVTGIDEHGLRTVRAVITRATTPDARRRVWAVVADLVDYTIGFASLSQMDGRILDAAVKETGDSAGLHDVMQDTLTLLPQEIFAATAGKNLLGSAEETLPTVKGLLDSVHRNGPEDTAFVFHGGASATFLICCHTAPEWHLALRDESFKVTDITKTLIQPGSVFAGLGYNGVLRAERNYGKMKYIFTAYFTDQKLQFAEAEAIPVTNRK